MVDETIPDISDAQLEQTLSDLELDDYVLVGKTKQDDGRWVLTVRKKASAAPPQQPAAALIPDDWMPECQMKRIICHWTAGEYTASKHDRECYHILIGKDGRLIRGDFSIKDNVSTADNVYAKHTKDCNTGSIGISVCCMADAVERPFNGGAAPMTPEQWDLLARVAAQLARRYKIPITSKTILGHGEVQTELNIEQEGKWDPMVLPWEPNVPQAEVGKRFRALVSQYNG